MTGQDLLVSAVALLGGDAADTTDYEERALNFINAMLADLFDVNNALLEAAGCEPLTVIPKLNSLSDVLPYAERICRGVMHFGLARDLGLGDGNPNEGYFAVLYDRNKLACCVFGAGTVTDDYSGSGGRNE